MIKQEYRKYAAAFIFLIATLALLWLLSFTPFLEILELKSYDFRMSVLRPPLDPPSDIVIVAIDESSVTELEEQGMPLPWPRSVHALLIQTLNEAGARLIAFDVTFDRESPPYLPQEDGLLAQAIRESRAPVVLVAYVSVVNDPRFTIIRPILPIDALLQTGAAIGFATLNPDRDTVLRQARLSVGDEPSLVKQILDQIGFEMDWHQVPASKSEGDDPMILINFVGGARSILTVSYVQAIDYQQALPDGIFSGKIVLVGRSLPVEELRGGVTEADSYPSPFDLLGEAGSTMHGVEIHANALNTILRGNFIKQPSGVQGWMIAILLAVLISAAALAADQVPLKAGVSLALMAGYLALACWAFVSRDYWLPTVQPTVAMLCVFGLNTLYQYRASERERALVRQALKGYVSAQVMGEVLNNPQKLKLGGTQLEATVLFSDIVGFSKISEKFPPAELASLLNGYFTRLGDEVMNREGMINKYIGDSIMAIWGAPLPNLRHAVLACRAALAIKEIAEADDLFKTRIGLNTGPMLAGNLGHQERMEYTVIGDAVNLASRLESANKAFGTTILISQATQALLEDRFLVRTVDWIRVVGRKEPVQVFEVLARLDKPLPEAVQEMTDSFQPILQSYQAGQWARALHQIEEHLKSFPHDSVARTYLERCQRYARTPPPSSWDGVYALSSK